LISQNIANNLFEKYYFLAAAAAVASKLFKNQNSDQKISLFFFLLSVGVENFGATSFCRLGVLSNDNKLSAIELFARAQCYKTFYVRNLRIFCNKLECLSLASLSSLALCLQVRQGAYLSKAPSKCSIIG
jgi:hypothetical protein